MTCCYDKRSDGASAFTISVADSYEARRHCPRVFGSSDLLAILRRLRDDGKTTNAQVQRLLSLPSSRVSEIFEGTRQIKLDEAKTLVEHFELEANPSSPALYLNEELLAPIVEEMVAQARASSVGSPARPLAQAFARYLELLEQNRAIHANPDALTAVARAIVGPAQSAKPEA